jgi:hypothetical protein
MKRAPQGALLAVWNGADQPPSLDLWCSELLAPPRRRPAIVEPGRQNLPGSFHMAYLTTVVAVTMSTSGSTSAMVTVQSMVPLVVGI